MKQLLLGLLFLLTVYSCKQTSTEYTGIVASVTINSEVLKRPVSANLYYSQSQGVPVLNVPVIYLLHGHGGDHMDWFQEEEGNVAHILDSLISHKLIPPVAALAVNAGNSWYVNSQEPMETFFTEEVFGFLDSYKIEGKTGVVNPDFELLAGDSAGGYGSLRFALLQPNRFKAVFLLSPAAYDPLPPAISSSRKIPVFAKDSIFNDSIWQAYNYPNLLGRLTKSVAKSKFYLSTGAQDAYNITPVVNSVKKRLDSLGQNTALTIIPGGHDWLVWRTNFANQLVSFFNNN